jgi:ATP-dependent RNA helicase RhlE
MATQTTRDALVHPRVASALDERPLDSPHGKTSILTTFNEFGLAEPILRALVQENYVTPTPIQAQTIPSALTGRDIVGIAQTGTGKTAAFALPILHRLAADPRPAERKTCRVLVLSPTRELSGQILDSFNAYGRNLKLSATLAIGGVPMGRQVRALLNGVDVLVATPGRLLDLVRSNGLRLGRVEYLVLDEADRMLDMGFIHDIRKIVGQLPSTRQTLFFSATMPQQIAELAKQMLRDPVRVAVAPAATTAERVEQRVIHVDRGAKAATLADLLHDPAVDRALVFTRTKHGADKVVRGLAKAGIAAHAIHGNKSQNQRERVLGEFRAGKIRTLVATDIAARGIDVDGISHVVNFDLPNEPETYVHRIGRTARAGATGLAISLCAGEETPYLRAIEKLIRQTIPAQGRRANAPRPHNAHNGAAHDAAAHDGAAHNGAAHNDAAHNGPAHAKPARPNRHRPRPAHAHGGRNEVQDGRKEHGGRKEHAAHAQGGRKEQGGRKDHRDHSHAGHTNGGHAHGGHAHGGRKENGGRNGRSRHGASQRAPHSAQAAPVYGQRVQSHGQPNGRPQSPAPHPRSDAQGVTTDSIGAVGFMRRPAPAR